MGLLKLLKFGAFKQQKNKKTKERLQTKNIKWFFTEEAKIKFETSVKQYAREMYETWKTDKRKLCFYTREKGCPGRREYPCTLIADYLRALKTIDTYKLSMDIANLAIKISDMAYPNCLMAEKNPLINFAIKFKPLYQCDKGKKIAHNSAMEMMIFYLHDMFLAGEDESNESWIYEKSLWYKANGKARKDYKIIKDISKKVRCGECLIYLKK